MVSRERVNQIIIATVLVGMWYYAVSHGMMLKRDPPVVFRGGRPKMGAGFFLYPTNPSFYARGDDANRMQQSFLRDREGVGLLTALCRHAAQKSHAGELPTMFDVGSEYGSWGTIGGMMGASSVVVQPKQDTFDYTHKTMAFMRISKTSKVVRRSLTDHIPLSKGHLVYNNTHIGVVVNGTVKNSDVPAPISMKVLMAEIGATDAITAKKTNVVGIDTPFLIHVGNGMRILPALESISETPSFSALVVDLVAGRSVDHFDTSSEEVTNRLSVVSKRLSDSGYSLFVLPGSGCPFLSEGDTNELVPTTLLGLTMFKSPSPLSSKIAALTRSRIDTESFCHIMWAKEDYFKQNGISMFHVFIALKAACVLIMCLRRQRSDKGRATR
eukprot:TRINITY_DN7075_c0_g1_i3.p1 TRINITY_DN7075_c0_g1~~TRINITY_DN7075_c0_g1_i3.p1  ORF type:complete len:384 (+),score=85.78 TRINITY_DN7075_c0_g1_i3:33-1184(+)